MFARSKNIANSFLTGKISRGFFDVGSSNKAKTQSQNTSKGVDVTEDYC